VILLVEDEDVVRALARRILVTSGYVVLEAHDGGEALAMSESHEGVIDLLLSDVMMPVLGGRELAERTAIGRPGMKVLFMSGHTPDAILREGIGKGIAFLPKPFRPADLVYKVREVLDSPARSQAQSGG
jgi:CheY-like chemotaxis protein